MNPLPGRQLIVAVSLLLSLLTGCTTQSLQRLAADDPRLPARVELTSTSFHPQDQYQCGPAALATVLESSGAPVPPDDLVAKVYVPKLEGSLQAEMISATRSYDRLAYRVQPAPGALMATLAEGYPVLVLLNLGVDAVPLWHYAVVVGYEDNDWLLRSGTQRRERMSARRFEGAWRRAQQWGIVVVAPDVAPATASANPYLEGVAGLEAAKRWDAALAGYRAASTRWPTDANARLGMGNVHYRLQQLAAAEADYREALSLDRDHIVARNNLAQVLLERGRPEEALVEIEAARAALTDPRFAPELAATESAVRKVLRDRTAQP